MKRLFLIVCFLLIPSFAMAASSRVLPASYTEHTYDSAGGGEDYTSLATWEDATDTDLVTGTSGYVLTCSSGVHNDSVTMAGATTNASYFRVIRAASGARGTPTSGARFEFSTATASLGVIVSLENYASIQDLGVKIITTATSDSAIAYGIVTTHDYVKVIGCYIYDCTSISVATGRAYGVATYQANNLVVDNCVISGTNGGASGKPVGIYLQDGGETNNIYLYNNTIINNEYYGIQASETGTLNIYYKNNIIQGNTTGATYSVFGTPQWNSTTNATSGVTFAADGYHLASNATVAIGNGTDLSADGSFAFDDDIDGETRSDWDIGADEYVASSTRRRVIIVGD